MQRGARKKKGGGKEKEWRESNTGMRTKNDGKAGIPITKRAQRQRERSLLRERCRLSLRGRLKSFNSQI